MKLGIHDLRFVSLKDVVSHEWEDPSRVDRLKATLQQDDILRNPPLVAQSRTRYVVLDGTTRTHALLDMGIQDLLVQVVDMTAPGFRLSTWHHMVSGISGDYMIQSLRDLNFKLMPLAFEEASAKLVQRELLCTLIVKNVGVYGVYTDQSSNGMVSRLNAIVDLYRGCEIVRVPSGHIMTALDEHPTAQSLFIFPQYTPAEILDVAEQGIRIPAGITRFIIPERMLGINVDLGLLRASFELDHKNRLLDRFLGMCVTEGKVRLYEEAVLVFEEQHLHMPQVVEGG